LIKKCGTIFTSAETFNRFAILLNIVQQSLCTYYILLANTVSLKYDLKVFNEGGLYIYYKHSRENWTEFFPKKSWLVASKRGCVPL